MADWWDHADQYITANEACKEFNLTLEEIQLSNVYVNHKTTNKLTKFLPNTETQ